MCVGGGCGGRVCVMLWKYLNKCAFFVSWIYMYMYFCVLYGSGIMKINVVFRFRINMYV